VFASLIGTTIEFFDVFIYVTAAVLVFPAPAGDEQCHPAAAPALTPRGHSRGCPCGDLEKVASVRKTLDSRDDDLESGRVKPIDGEEAISKSRETSERRRSGG
jgi:hypothetical protein